MKQNYVNKKSTTAIDCKIDGQQTNMPPENETLKTRPSAAHFLNVKTQTLAVWACTKRYPLPYIKVGRRVMYRQSDLDAFIESNLVGGVA